MKYYTYIHYKADTNEPFYIGKGFRKRAYVTKNRNKWWHAIVNKHGYKVEILSRFETNQEALDHEIFLISTFRQLGYKLCNLTDGGEGMCGYSPTQLTRQRMAISHKRRYDVKRREEARAFFNVFYLQQFKKELL
jgi:hypothetical protein